MARFLFFDTEANSLDVNLGFIQEIAWALYDSETGRCLEAKSNLLKWNRGYTVDDGALAVTGLSRAFCEEHGRDAGEVFEEFLDIIMTQKAHYLVGHNILGFDIPILRSNVLRSSYPNAEVIDSITPIDTYIDLPYPDSMRNYSLKYLALDHGYALLGAHQALNDVFACAHVFFKYPLSAIIASAHSPVVEFEAYTSYHDAQARSELKRLKFWWNPEKKCWRKSARKSYAKIIRETFKGSLFIDGNLHDPDQPPPEPQMELPF